jgi:hypothetical protein
MQPQPLPEIDPTLPAVDEPPSEPTDVPREDVP